MKKKLICHYCDSEAKLESSLKVYKQDYGLIWICSGYPVCDAYVGCHPGTHEPLGLLADEETRTYRKEAHKYFDTLWRTRIKILDLKKGFDPRRKHQIRGKAYKWLANELEIDKKYCHIGMFDIEMCKMTIEVCAPYYENIINQLRI